MERTPPPQFNQWSQRRKRRGGGNNTSCCTPFLPTLTAIHNKPKQPDRTRKEREREKRHQTHMIDAPGWGDQCLVWAPNRQAMLHTWIYTPSPPLIVSGGGLSANGGGGRQSLSFISFGRKSPLPQSAVGYSWPEAMEGICPYV